MSRVDDEDEAPEGLRIVDTTNMLTTDELRELKKLARLSRTTRAVVALLFGVISALGLPIVMEWAGKHWQ